jgi:hypothetical protein
MKKGDSYADKWNSGDMDVDEIVHRYIKHMDTVADNIRKDDPVLAGLFKGAGKEMYDVLMPLLLDPEGRDPVTGEVIESHQSQISQIIWEVLPNFIGNIMFNLTMVVVDNDDDKAGYVFNEFMKNTAKVLNGNLKQSGDNHDQLQ